MDWNGAKVDHVIASRTRLEEIGIEELRFVPKRHIHLSMKNGPGLHRVFAELLSISCNFLPKSIGWKDDNVGSKPEIERCFFELETMSAHGK